MIDIDELERLAKAANTKVKGGRLHRMVLLHEDKEYIKFAGPAKILELIERLRKAESICEEYKACP